MPEKAISFDAGIEQQLAGGRALAALTWFENRFRDQIGYAVTDYQTFEGSFFNLGRTRARGLETVVRGRLGEAWHLSGAYTYMDSRVLESASPGDPVFAEGQPLLRRPRHSGAVDLRWQPGRWTLGANALMVGRRADSDFAGLDIAENPGYLVVNFLSSLRLTESASVYVLVNNALNQRYMEVFGYPALRAHFRAGIRLGF